MPTAFGLFLLGEIEYYTRWELVGVLVGILFCVGGVRLIMLKSKMAEQFAQEIKKQQLNP